MLIAQTVITEWIFYVSLGQVREDSVQRGWTLTSVSVWWSLKPSQASGSVYLPDFRATRNARLSQFRGALRNHQATLESLRWWGNRKWLQSQKVLPVFPDRLDFQATTTCSQLSPLTKHFEDKDYSSSERFWEALNNLASGEYISWPLSLGSHVHLLGVGEESPLSFPSQCLFLDLPTCPTSGWKPC